MKYNTGYKRLRKVRKDLKLAFSDNEKDENTSQKRRTWNNRGIKAGRKFE